MAVTPGTPSSPGTFVFDGDCAFCSSSARTLVRIAPSDAAVVAWQRSDLDALGLTPAACELAVQWVDGPRHASGAAAIAAYLRTSRPWCRAAGWLLSRRPVLALAEPVYRWVARHRHALPGGTPACRLPPAA